LISAEPIVPLAPVTKIWFAMVISKRGG